MFSLREGFDQMDFDRVHEWLASSYWSPGIAREKVERAARGSSLLVGAFDGDEQVGYLRIISDQATFAWVCDVFVAEAARGQGIAKAMVRYAQAHSRHQGLRRWVLATKDAQEVYAACDFQPLWEPQRWMIYWPGEAPTC